MLNDGGIRSNRNNKKKNGSDEEEQPILSDAERSGSNKTLDLLCMIINIKRNKLIKFIQ